MSFNVIPAIDLRVGRVVRLRQGDYTRETVYAFDPIDLARQYANAGACWLHVVDLDGARSGNLENLQTIAALARCGLRIQAGGGVRSGSDLQRLFNVGVERVVIGSIAVSDPEQVIEWLQIYGAQRLVIALDTRLRDGVWRLASAGWTQTVQPQLEQLAPRFAAADAVHLLCTDIDCDGMLCGPNLNLYRDVQKIAPALCVQASGGVRDLNDIRAARDAGAAGVILGRALLDGNIWLADALAC